MRVLHEKYIVNEKGKKTAVVLSFPEWQKVLNILEEYDDIKGKSEQYQPVFDRIKELYQSWAKNLSRSFQPR